MTVRGNLFIVSAPSGAGKSSLISGLLQGQPTDKQVSVSHTTRKPRQGEINGQHYHFVTTEEFTALIADNAFSSGQKYSVITMAPLAESSSKPYIKALMCSSISTGKALSKSNK